MSRRRRFGRVRQLPSGRWQARYRGRDGLDHPAPHTFERKADADRWLARAESLLVDGGWIDPDAGKVPLGEFARSWVAERAGLRPNTRQLYASLVRLHIQPELGHRWLSDLGPAHVRAWRAGLLTGGTGPITVAKAYRVLRTIMQTAVDDGLIRVNPCQIKGAATERSPERPVLSVSEVYAVAAAVPDRWRALVLMATFCSLRWGELSGLAREDVDLDAGLVHVRRSVSELDDGTRVIGPPKSAAGRRVVATLSGLLPDVRKHLATYVGPADDDLMFVGPKGGPLRRRNFQKIWNAARIVVGREDLHFHDLRHTGNTLAAQLGATLPDLMARMGHSSARAALVYLHTSSTRDRAIAERLDGLIRENDRARSGHEEASEK
jgi:integrase